MSIADAVLSLAQRTRYCTAQVWESCCISLPANCKGQSYREKHSRVWKSHSGKEKVASHAIRGWSAEFSHGWKSVTVKWPGIQRECEHAELLDTALQRILWRWGIPTDHHLRHYGTVSEKYVWGNTGLQPLAQYYWRWSPSEFFRE